MSDVTAAKIKIMTHTHELAVLIRAIKRKLKFDDSMSDVCLFNC